MFSGQPDFSIKLNYGKFNFNNLAAKRNQQQHKLLKLIKYLKTICLKLNVFY